MLTPEQRASRERWARVHVAGDRREPVYLSTPVRTMQRGPFLLRFLRTR